MIRRSFGSRVWRTGIVGRGFTEKAAFSERTEDFVGAHMQKYWSVLRICPILPETFGGLEQAKGSENICSDKRIRSDNRAVHVRFGGKMNHRVNFLLLEQRVDQRLIADIPLDEAISIPLFYTF